MAKKRDPRIREIRAAGSATIPTDPGALLSIRDLQYLARCSRQTIYRWVNNGQFPPPDKRPGAGRKAWLRSTYDAWIASKDGGSAEAVIVTSSGGRG
jgi:predicted DNA-binding transcriptional regulator AlpA